MTIRPELIDELLKDCSDPREVLAEGGFLKQLTKAINERCLETELDTHLATRSMDGERKAPSMRAMAAAARGSKEHRALYTHLNNQKDKRVYHELLPIRSRNIRETTTA